MPFQSVIPRFDVLEPPSLMLDKSLHHIRLNLERYTSFNSRGVGAHLSPGVLMV